MELHFRQRLDRPDKQGRASIFADLHWAGGHRWKLPTGVKVLPVHWQPTKTKRIHPAADNSTQLNLRLTRLLPVCSRQCRPCSRRPRVQVGPRPA